MGKLVTKGFTETDGKVVEVTILGYDNNKRARVRNADGTEESVHRGYIFADEKLTRNIADVNWFIHGGGSRKNYKPRTLGRKPPEFSVYDSDTGRVQPRGSKTHPFRNKAAVVAYSSSLARRTNAVIEVASQSRSNRSKLGWTELVCYPSGHVLQYGGRLRRPRGDVYKYLRGYGRRFN